ncbi:MAG: acyl--CoA ligase [Desulfobacteraceae bacterium]|nr:acyl--CoA ligase [Desulfobacteraceae bacterium]
MLSVASTEFSAKISDKPAIIKDDDILTWSQLCKKIHYYTRDLEKLKTRRLLLHLDQDGNSIALLIASTNLNIETILIPSYYPQRETVSFMEKFDGDCVIRAENENIRIISTREHGSDRCLESSEPHVGLLSSGTTGPPKCIRHSWQTLSAAVKKHERFMTKKWFSGYPVVQFSGLQVFLQCYLNGGCLIISESPEHARKTVSRHGVHYLNCTPTYIRQLLMSGNEHMGASLKHVTLSGEIVDQQVLDLVKAKLPETRITHIYASSELGAVIETRDGQEGFDAALIDNKRLKMVGEELYVKPSSRSMTGYLGEEKTDSRWFATKDFVKIEGNRGFFMGRKDDIINVGGANVNPHTVESVIRNLDCILEVSVMGHKNPLVGNLVKAAVCIKQENDEDEVRQKIIDTCKEKLPYYMQPRIFDFVDKIDTTQTFKIKRKFPGMTFGWDIPKIRYNQYNFSDYNEFGEARASLANLRPPLADMPGYGVFSQYTRSNGESVPQTLSLILFKCLGYIVT